MTVSKHPSSLTVRLDSPLKTMEFGQLLANALTDGSILALTGELGSGKTQFTRGIGVGLGVPEEQITSPTFTLIQEYPSSPPLIHVDLYRLETPGEIGSLGLVEYFQEPYIVIIEWAERMHDALPTDHLCLEFVYGEQQDTRIVSFHGAGPKSQTAVDRIQTLLSHEGQHTFPQVNH